MPRASAGPFRQATFDWPTLIANKDKEIARLEGLYTANVEKSGARIVKTRAVIEDAHTLRLADRRDGHGEIHPDRDRRRAQSRPGDSRHRARDLVERGVSPEGAAEAHRDPGRRLYRAGVRLHLRRLRLRRDRGLSRRQHPARLRRGRARPSAQRDGEGGHHDPDRLHRHEGRQARQGVHHRICRTDRASPPTR